MPGPEKITVGTKMFGENLSKGKISLLNTTEPKPKLLLERTTPPPSE